MGAPDPKLYREVVIDGTRHWHRIRDVPRPRDRFGWRVLYTRPAEKRLTLYSPLHGSNGLDDSACSTREMIQRASCPFHPEHAPPAAGCTCGVYAVDNVVDGVYRLRVMTRNIRSGDPGSHFPPRPSRAMAPVLARVWLGQAVEHQDDAEVGYGGTRTPVLRAAGARITRLFVSDELAGSSAACDLACRLGTDFGVGTAYGVPAFSRLDWDTRPAWMRTEPWRTRYGVDAALDGLAPVKPLHVTFVCAGNICRSPMAAIMFTHWLDWYGLGGAVRVTSAGTHGAHHSPGGPHELAVSVLRAQGYPTAHKATQVGDEHLAADLIVALDRSTAGKLTALGAPSERIRLLRSFDPGAATMDIANPYGGSAAAFEATYSLIAAALPGLHTWVDDQQTASNRRAPR